MLKICLQKAKWCHQSVLTVLLDVFGWLTYCWWERRTTLTFPKIIRCRRMPEVLGMEVKDSLLVFCIVLVLHNQLHLSLRREDVIIFFGHCFITNFSATPKILHVSAIFLPSSVIFLSFFAPPLFYVCVAQYELAKRLFPVLRVKIIHCKWTSNNLNDFI